jgi:hypothetical protein
MIRSRLLPALVLLALPAAGLCESIILRPDRAGAEAVLVVRGSAAGQPAADASPAGVGFELALARMLTGLCRLDPGHRAAAATGDIAEPFPARF